MFPDEATLFLAGIEDQDYKEEKIGCAFAPRSHRTRNRPLTLHLPQSGTMFTVSTTPASRRLRLRSRW